MAPEPIPRCAPVFYDPGIISAGLKRSYPAELNPDTTPAIGCKGRCRRLALKRDEDEPVVDKAFCRAHQRDHYFVSAEMTAEMRRHNNATEMSVEMRRHNNTA